MHTQQEQHYTEKLSCSKETKTLIMHTCVKIFLDHHPELRGTKITQGHILRRIAEYYCE